MSETLAPPAASPDISDLTEGAVTWELLQDPESFDTPLPGVNYTYSLAELARLFRVTDPELSSPCFVIAQANGALAPRTDGRWNDNSLLLFLTRVFSPAGGVSKIRPHILTRTRNQVPEASARKIPAADENDMVNHPQHYNSHPSGVEVIELVRYLPFSLGNAMKYLLRYQSKGSPLQDLDKATWYLKDFLDNPQLLPSKHFLSSQPNLRAAVTTMVAAEPNTYVAAVLSSLQKVLWSDAAHLLTTDETQYMLEQVSLLREEVARAHGG